MNMFAQPVFSPVFPQFFAQPMTPAVRAQLEAQFSMYSDMTQRLFQSAQKINDLNIQVAQAVVEESLNGAHQVMAAKDTYEAAAIAAGQAQPVAERVRAYQQHLTNIAAGTQAELSRAAEQHIPETTRAASAVAEEVARNVNEESERSAERQRAAIEKLKNNPLRTQSFQNGHGQAQPGQTQDRATTTTETTQTTQQAGTQTGGRKPATA